MPASALVMGEWIKFWEDTRTIIMVLDQISTLHFKQSFSVLFTMVKTIENLRIITIKALMSEKLMWQHWAGVNKMT